MRPENLLALRYIKSRKRNRLMSFLSLVSIIGIALGVATLIIVVSVMTGFTNNLKEKLLGANPEITVSRFNNLPIDNYTSLIGKINSVEGVKASAPFVYGQALLTSERSVTGAIIKAIDPLLEVNVSRLQSFIIEGDLAALLSDNDSVAPILLGRELAVNLGAYIGSEVTMVSPYGSRGPFGTTPKMRRFKVSGLFDTGISEYNSSMAYIGITEAQKFFNIGDTVSGISVSVLPGVDLEKETRLIGQKIQSAFWVRDWTNMNRSLFSALKLERLAMFIVLTLIIIVASFNIVSMISITIKDKRKDIAILRAFGAGRKLITKVFVRQGLIVGMAGTILGDILAFVISICLKEFKIIELPQDIYFVDTIPINIDFSVYLLVTLCALVIVFIASALPSRQASKTSPIEALRND